MKRKTRIYQYVTSKTAHLKKEDLEVGAGLTTAQIAEALDMVRTNVSKELNDLVREGMIEKVSGRPVRYIDKAVLQRKPLSTFVKSYKHIEEEPIDEVSPSESDLFSFMIGANGSLKNQVEQAKAAILYPPKGLNSLVIGPTGVGKTYFANAMFQFTRSKGIIAENKQLITFNCADYAHNPQLLMSHLFGHVKGAFTGANEEKEGLVEKADKGMLFLDEVHRLPPEGQEMIFYLMDTGQYQKLGESGKHRVANVRLVCATTENPESSLLQTFVRRIPITIQLPAFEERPAKEKVKMIELLFSYESERINREIHVTDDVVKALIGSVTYGNVGQLKSNIQLVCAKGFLKYMDTDEPITIELLDLPPNIKDGLFAIGSDRKELQLLTDYLVPKMVINPKQKRFKLHQDAYELPFNLYEIIGDKAAILKAEGIDQEHINNFITTDINVHLKSFYQKSDLTTNTEDKLSAIVDEEIISLTKRIQKLAEHALGHKFQERFLYAMSLHLSSFIKRLKSGIALPYQENIEEVVNDYPKEYQTSLEIKSYIEKMYHIRVPQEECWYLTILLASLKEDYLGGRVGIVVAAHGSSTASSMVQVVSKLLGVNNLRAIDMPLEMSPRVAFDLVIEQIRDVDAGNGVLFLVDMGSLASFEEELIETTGIQIRTMDMVTTPIILEAARKTTLIDNDLESIYQSLKGFLGYSNFLDVPEENEEKLAENLLPKAFLSICSTGEGTAHKIKELIENTLDLYTHSDYKIIPVAIPNMTKEIDQLKKIYHIVGAVGVMAPKQDIPFIPLEDLISGVGEGRLKHLLDEEDISKENLVRPVMTKETCLKYLEEFFTFLNPYKVIDLLWRYVELLSEKTDRTFSNSFIIGLVMHVAGALERTILDDPLSFDGPLDLESKKDYEAVREANHLLEESLGLAFSDNEVYYILQIFETQLTEVEEDVMTELIDD